MSKFITKEELLEAKCEAYKVELKKVERLLGKANVLLVNTLSYGESLVLNCEIKKVLDDIHKYYNEEE
jgi:SMC interacting uncharacterized protein involved in chromosome segregation